MPKLAKRIISVGFVKPEILKGNTIYVQLRKCLVEKSKYRKFHTFLIELDMISHKEFNSYYKEGKEKQKEFHYTGNWSGISFEEANQKIEDIVK